MPPREIWIIVEIQNVMQRKTRGWAKFSFLRPLKLKILPVGPLARKNRVNEARLADLYLTVDKIN